MTEPDRPGPADPVLDAINRLRQIRGLSQDDLARRAGDYQGHLSRLFTGLQIPRLDVVRNLADALDCDLAVMQRCPCGSRTCHNWTRVAD